jgi:glutathione synthase/RimK-type ligase-like ATP-grasp enzyme
MTKQYEGITMSLKAKVCIHPLPDHHLTKQEEIRFPKRFSAWKLNNLQIKISFGKQTVDVVCNIHEEKEDVLFCSHTLAKQLLLPLVPTTVSISYDRNEEKMSFGPVFAVLTTVKQDNASVHFNSINDFCKELASFSNQHGIFFYVFQLSDFHDDYVYGYMYNNQRWHKHKLPHPNAIYNRLHSRAFERSETAKSFFEMCRNSGIPYFNDRYLNKWEVHEKLKPYSHLIPHLPDTTPFTEKHHLLSMLKRYSCIYIKPIYGSMGKHIYRVTKEVDQYCLKYSSFSQENVQLYDNVTDLYEALSRKVGKKAFIIQQGIPLYTYKDRTIDFRILCNRDYFGEWFVSSFFARLSKKENFVSNVAQGGELLKPDQVLENFPKKMRTHILKGLQELALEVCKQINIESDGEFGELGIDLAIDTSGDLWLIEANIKPSKNLDGEINATKVRPSAKAILQYGSFLANH